MKMKSTTIAVSFETKEKLEKVRWEFKTISMNNTINALIDFYQKNK